VSEINLGLYQTVLAPAVRSMVTEHSAEAMRAAHPNRMRFAAFSDRNPFMQPVKALAESVRAVRKPVKADNPLLAMERAATSWITTYLEVYGEFRDQMTETIFLNTYGSPLLQAMVGMGVQQTTPQNAERDLVREAREAQLRAYLERSFEAGGLEEAVLRALIHIRLAEGSIDERGYAMLKLIRASRPAAKRISLARFKEMLREQYLLVRLDEERALRTLPELLGEDDAARKTALDVLHRVLRALGDLSEEASHRLTHIETLFGANPRKAVKAEASHA